MPLLSESQLQRLDYSIHTVGAHKHDDGKWCSGSSSMQCVQLSQLSLQETDQHATSGAYVTDMQN